MSDLKPCPFCGSSDLELYDEEQVIVRCRDCDARGPSCNLDRKAQLAWNVRPGEDNWKKVAEGFKDKAKEERKRREGILDFLYRQWPSVWYECTEACKTCKHRHTIACQAPDSADDDWCGAYKRSTDPMHYPDYARIGK